MTTDKVLDAQDLGVTQARAEFDNGNVGPVESPLSGEWAGSLTPQDLGARFGARNDDDLESLSDSFETGYFGAWQDCLAGNR